MSEGDKYCEKKRKCCRACVEAGGVVLSGAVRGSFIQKARFE